MMNLIYTIIYSCKIYQIKILIYQFTIILLDKYMDNGNIKIFNRYIYIYIYKFLSTRISYDAAIFSNLFFVYWSVLSLWRGGGGGMIKSNISMRLFSIPKKGNFYIFDINNFL